MWQCSKSFNVRKCRKNTAPEFREHSNRVRCAVCLVDSLWPQVSNSLWPRGSLQAPLSMGVWQEYSRQVYWSGLPCPLPEDLPNPEIKPKSLSLQADFFFYHWSHQEGPRVLEWVTQDTWILSPGGLPYPGIELGSPALQVDSFSAELINRVWEGGNSGKPGSKEQMCEVL